MSLITRCPACETLFKVVPDQLRISEGWVRCGQCDEIFDASIHLLQDLPVAQHVPVESSLDPDFPGSFDDVRIGPEPEPEPEPEWQPASVEPPVEPELLPGVVLSPEEVISAPMGLLDAQVDTPSADFSKATLYAHVASVDADDVDRGAENDDVSFLRDQKTGSFWHKPLTRVALILLSSVLLLALLGQIVFHERDRIAASEPGLTPWLLSICGALNCTLSPVRKIESIVIDSASFTKIRGDSYRLNLTVKNNAVLALALPAIELTLTDSLDQPVIRRVFRTEELGVKSATLAAGREWTVSLAMAVSAAGASDRVAGYRVLAFYP